jgi:hypothetical protein
MNAIPLVIEIFRKKDGGISVVAKNVLQSERFLTTTIKKGPIRRINPVKILQLAVMTQDFLKFLLVL